MLGKADSVAAARACRARAVAVPHQPAADGRRRLHSGKAWHREPWVRNFRGRRYRYRVARSAATAWPASSTSGAPAVCRSGRAL